MMHGPEMDDEPNPKPVDWDSIPPKQQHMLVAWSDALVTGKAVVVAFLWVAGAIGIVAGAIYYTLASRTEYSRHAGLGAMKMKALAMLGIGLSCAAAIAYAAQAPATLPPPVAHAATPFISRNSEWMPARYIHIHYQRAARRWQ